jgi:tRNA(Ile)-lysidine synthase
LRHWHEGDRFCPFGMRGSKKLSDFFIDQKINLLEKKNVQVLCSADKIVWLVGLRSDDRFKIDHQTENYYKIQYYGSI